MDDRFLAYKILSKIEHDKAYSNIALDAVLSANNADYAPFVSAVVYGVIERKITLDYILSQYLKQPLKKLNPQVLTVLRMGVYQLKYMDKVPARAAVNESVILVKKIKCAYSASLVNSVLRKISADDFSFPETGDRIYDMSVKYSCPEALVKSYADDYGFTDAEGILESSLGAAPVCLRVNTLKISAEDLIKLLENEGVCCDLCDIPDCLTVMGGKAVHKTQAYAQGLFHVQDKASQICVQKLCPKPGETVIDMCASPGGKSFTMAQYMNNIGKIISVDLYEHRVNLIKSGAGRLGISIIEGITGDSSVFNPSFPAADKILCDVPCSGMGVIRRKPEIRYKNLGFIDKLCELQYNILKCAGGYLKPGGALVYSTCSLCKKENQGVCDRFLNSESGFTKAELSGDDGYLTLMPHKNGTDGFFIAKFIKG